MINVVINGVTYSYPQTGDQSWGDNATNAFVALAGSTLQKSGGNFTLTADVNFGGSFGLLSQYFTTRSATPATSGIFRLADTDGIGWRNHANSGNILLAKNTSDQLTWAGVPIVGPTGLVPASAGGTGIDTSGSTGVPVVNAGTWSVPAQLPIAKGGTNVSSVTTTPTATAFAGWDANKNISANNLLDGYTTTATAAGTTTLTVGSTGLQFFTGSTTQTVVMPVTGTLALGQQYIITNLSSGVVTVQSSGANVIQAMAANTQLALTCISLSGTGTASWAWLYSPAQSGALAIAQGGTGQTAKTAAYDALSPNTTKGDIEVNNGTNNVRQAVGTDTFVLTADSSQATGVKWAAIPAANDPRQLTNASIAASVAANALTVALKTAGGSNPSAGSPVNIAFRDATSTAGDYTIVSITGSLSVVAPSGTTIGTQSGVATYIYVYAINNAGTAELAMSLTLFDEGSVVTTTAISGGASASTMYSTTARSNVPVRLIGRISISEATAGTWATSPTEASPVPFSNLNSTIGTPIHGSNTNDSAAAGYVGEYVQSVISVDTSWPTSTNWGDLTSISLTAGDWDVTGTIIAENNGSTNTAFDIGISTTTGNSATGLTYGSNYFETGAAAANHDQFLVVPSYRISLSATTTVYLKYRAVYSAGTPNARGRLSARRVR